MIEFEGMARFAFAVAGVAGLVLILRWLGDRDGPTLADLFRIQVDPPLRRGAREEEARPWRLDRLSRPHTGEPRLLGVDVPRPAVGCSPRARLPQPD
jgi:hypothetical protein